MRKSQIMAVGAGLVLLLSGCTAAVSSDGESSAPDAGAGSCPAGLADEVAAAMEPTALVAPEAGLDLSALAGKSIWYITNSQNQFSTETRRSPLGSRRPGC